MPPGSSWTARLESLASAFPEDEIIVDPEASRASLPRLDAILALRLDPADYEAASSLKAGVRPLYRPQPLADRTCFSSAAFGPSMSTATPNPSPNAPWR